MLICRPKSSVRDWRAWFSDSMIQVLIMAAVILVAVLATVIMAYRMD